LRQVLLLGSVPLSDSKQVFETVAKILNGSVKRIPDGETGPRSFWMRWQGAVFSDDPQFELAKTTSTTHAQGYTYQHYRMRDDVDPAALRIGPLGYARHAKSSYESFSQLKQAGVIARDIRFQVCMATPLAHLWAYVAPEHQSVVERPLLAGFAAEIEQILAVVPAGELAIQWDMPHDVLSIEGNRKLHVDVSRAGLQQRWSELAEKIPPAAEVGFHFCYGDSGGKHSIEPRDTKVMVDFANDLTAAIARPISYFHFPVPIERSDEGFFAPLKGLNLTAGTELFLGLVHPQDGVEGARRRIASASAAVSDFGIGTECGFGRRDPKTILALLQLHAEIAALAA
jgi:hypothetical protein